MQHSIIKICMHFSIIPGGKIRPFYTQSRQKVMLNVICKFCSEKKSVRIFADECDLDRIKVQDHKFLGGVLISLKIHHVILKMTLQTMYKNMFGFEMFFCLVIFIFGDEEEAPNKF